MQEKIKQLDSLLALVSRAKTEKKKVVLCHGVFDLLHPGHIRHLQEAKKQGDQLIVSLTPDHFVNKGPGRPAFHENLRLEQVASLACVDFVILNDTPDARAMIRVVKPDIYVKGEEYLDHEADVTGKINQEVEAVEDVGGKIHYTKDIVFSSSGLINHFFDPDAKRLAPFISQLKERHCLEEMLEKIESLSQLKVLVVGDAIIDEYQYVDPLGQSGKGVHFTACLKEKEIFLGGSLMIANHLASFVKEVTLLTGVGKNASFSELAPNVNPEFVYFETFSTLTKKRYVIKEGEALTKLFETYSTHATSLGKKEVARVVDFIKKRTSEFDLILVSDFGNGFTNPEIIDALCTQPHFLAVNTQTNSGNRGFNMISHYPRADFISLNEGELRLAAHNRSSPLDEVVEELASVLNCPKISITRGVKGVHLHEQGKESFSIPALTMHSIDRVGAGDSYFALASLFAAKQLPLILGGFMGSIAAAMDVQIVGNKEAIDKASLCKYLTRLMK